MAKRVSPEEKPFNPVEDKLAQETLRPTLAANTALAEPRAEDGSPTLLAAPRVVSIAARRDPADGPVQGPAGKPATEVEKLSREKRVLLTESEEDTLEQLVKDMGKRLGTPLKLSHMLRAATVLLVNSREELLKQSEKAGRLKRPPNNDPVALANFEHNLARLIDRAIRGSRVLE